jgi:hypothetical protein
MILEGMTLSSGLSFTPPPMVVPPIDLLVVAGGAAGAANGGNYTPGGGGAGGLIWATGLTFYNGTYTVTVGAGGAGVNGASGRQGNSGGSSSVTGTSISRVTTSGDGGRYGSGGIQGSADGVPGYAGYYANSGGGGGAGGAATSKDGGPARLISELNGITGYNNTGYFAGGGAGYNGTWGTTTGGGGDTWTGTFNGPQSGISSAAPNTGSGGAPAPYNSTIQNPGKGGSGITVMRYADSYAAATATTGSPTITVTGGYRYYIFNSSGSITF